MNTINKVTFFIFGCITFSSMSTHCDDGRDIMTPALTGAAIGGLAGGRRGAGIGLGVGLLAGTAASSSNRRRRNDDYYYEKQERERAQRKHRSVKQKLEDCMDENEALKDEISMLQRQLRRR